MLRLVYHILVALLLSQRARQIVWTALKNRSVPSIVAMMLAGIAAVVVITWLGAEFESLISSPVAPAPTPPVAPVTPPDVFVVGTSSYLLTFIALLGIVACFGILIFGGEINHFFRTLVYVILLVATLTAGHDLLSTFTPDLISEMPPNVNNTVAIIPR